MRRSVQVFSAVMNSTVLKAAKTRVVQGIGRCGGSGIKSCALAMAGKTLSNFSTRLSEHQYSSLGGRPLRPSPERRAEIPRSPPGSADDPNASNLFTWTLTASNVQADYTAAYNAISGTKLTFNFH